MRAYSVLVPILYENAIRMVWHTHVHFVLLRKCFAKVFISYLSGLTGVTVENYKDSDTERHAINIISVLMLIAATFLLYLVGTMMPAKYVTWMLDIQLYAMLAGAFILLYNGRRGYNKKWFQYGSYLYYPVHMAIIYLIFWIL